MISLWFPSSVYFVLRLNEIQDSFFSGAICLFVNVCVPFVCQVYSALFCPLTPSYCPYNCFGEIFLNSLIQCEYMKSVMSVIFVCVSVLSHLAFDHPSFLSFSFFFPPNVCLCDNVYAVLGHFTQSTDESHVSVGVMIGVDRLLLYLYCKGAQWSQHLEKNGNKLFCSWSIVSVCPHREFESLCVRISYSILCNWFWADLVYNIYYIIVFPLLL